MINSIYIEKLNKNEHVLLTSIDFYRELKSVFNGILTVVKTFENGSFLVAKVNPVKTLSTLIKIVKADYKENNITNDDIINMDISELVSYKVDDIIKASIDLVKINSKELEILKDYIYSDYLGYSKEEIKHRILLDVIMYNIDGEKITIKQQIKKEIKKIRG